MENYFTNSIEESLDILHKKGAFLTVKSDDCVNTMTISWGNIGYQWGKPMFTALVRKSRHTYNMIEKSNEFTISITDKGSMKSNLAFCGSKSGRDVDKIKELGLELVDGNKISTPTIGGCKFNYECKVVYKHPIMPNVLDDEIRTRIYNDNDYHTFYYGEIVDFRME